MSEGSNGSFIDHGSKADHHDGSRPQWFVEEGVLRECLQTEDVKDCSSTISPCSSSGSDGSVCSPLQDNVSADMEGVVAALRHEKRKTKCLLRDKRRLEAEVVGLKVANASLLECNCLLARHNSSLAASVATLVMKHDQTQFAVTTLVSQTQEINSTLRMLYDQTVVK